MYCIYDTLNNRIIGDSNMTLQQALFLKEEFYAEKRQFKVYF
jgi:hypothetical protein